MMNYRTIFSIVIIGVFLLSGCSRKVRTPINGHRGSYQTVRPGTSDQPAPNADTPKRATLTQPVKLPDFAQPSYQEETRLPVSIEFVEGRILSYNKKLEKWKEYDSQSSVLNLDLKATEKMVSCFRSLQSMINGYSRLRQVLSADSDTTLRRTMSHQEIQLLQEGDISLLESFCGRLLENDSNVTMFGKSVNGKDPAQLAGLIKQSFQNKEYEQVVQLWLEIPEEKLDSVALQTKLTYAKSLMYLHQERKAALIYEQIIDDIEQKKGGTHDVLGLYKVLSNLYIAAQDYSNAIGQYRKIQDKYQEVLRAKEWSELQQSILKNSRIGSRELDEYSAILRNYMGYIPSQDGYKPVQQAEQFLEKYPESPTVTNVDAYKAEMSSKAERWFQKLISDVRELQMKEQYQDGLLLLETIQQDIIGPEQAQLVGKISEELRGANETVLEGLRQKKMQELEKSWNDALNLVEIEQYDEAIDRFKLLLETDYHDKASSKIVEVSLLAAKDIRKNAGMIFMRAIKTTEPEMKKQLLVESHQLLLSIVLKYPNTRISDKVTANLRRVELEMNKLDPGLVEWSKASAQQQKMLEDQKGQDSMNNENEQFLLNDENGQQALEQRSTERFYIGQEKLNDGL